MNFTSFSPEVWWGWLSLSGGGLLAVFLLGSTIFRLRNRNNLMVSRFKIKGGTLPFSGRDLTESVFEKAKNIRDAHPSDTRYNRIGELNNLGRPQRVHERIEVPIKIVPPILSEVLGLPGVGFIVALPGRIFRASTLRGSISVEVNSIECSIYIDGPNAPIIINTESKPRNTPGLL